MSQDAREFAESHGAMVMLYPNTQPELEQRFLDCPEITASQIVNRERIIALRSIFLGRWPSNG